MPDQQPTDNLTGAQLIARERERQQSVEGWTPEHDDQHVKGQLALAAISYAAPDYSKIAIHEGGIQFSHPWPFLTRLTRYEEEWVQGHPKTKGDRLHDLVRAGALIAAEIDRLQRQQAASNDGGDDAR